jgi:hypothetical protein
MTALSAPDENHAVILQLSEFIRSIGIPVTMTRISGDTFVPGIRIDHGTLLVDRSRLTWPGDLLHEAAHLAMVPADSRTAFVDDAGDGGGEEMGAIAWSWAALVHLGLEPSVVFHDGGYRGGSQNLIDNFQNGRYVGVPFLRWIGLAGDDYPVMLKWLRD